MKNRRTNKVHPPWDHEYYVARMDHKVLYLWHVKRRSTKEIVAGGWSEKSQAINWLKANWVKQLEKDIENILLVNE